MNNIINIAAGSVAIPDIYDDFSDGKYQNRIGTDPWGRPLPEWTVESGLLDASNGYIKATSLGYASHATISTPTTITKGTWVFKYKWLNGPPSFVGNYYLISLLSQFLTPSGVTKGYDSLYKGLYLENPPDGHWWGGSGYIIPRNYHFGYIVSMTGSQIDKSLVGGNNWHEVVFIKDADGFVYSWLDGVFVRWTSDKMEDDEIPDSTKFLFDFYDGSGTPLQYPMVIDDIKIYKDQYIPPNNAIIYNFGLNSIVINGFGANLSSIAAAINNPSIFSYNPLTNTATAYKDITIGRGSELRVENGKLLMSSSYDGERKINYYTDAIFKINNSTIDSINNYYFQWKRLSDGDSNLKNTFRVVNSTINNSGGIVLERPVAFYIVNSNFTNLVGSYPVDVYFRWPQREFKIENSIFSGKTGTEKIRLNGGSQFGELSPKAVGMDIVDSDLSHVTFECVQDSPYYLSPEYPRCVANIINTKLGQISYSGTTLRYKYYLDVRTVNSNGTPVSGAIVAAVNENDDVNYPAENLVQGKKYFQLLNQLSPTGQPYFSGQTTNWFKGWADSNDHNASITDLNGRIPLPSNMSNILVLTSKESSDSSVSSYTYKVTASKNGYANSLSNIIPDSSWCRSNQDEPTYSITVIIPDSSPGLHLTGFAPSESNPFPVGQSKKFVVWADQALTSMKWYLDGNIITTGSMNYNWTASAGLHTIRFEGSNANGNILQQWNINGGSGAPSIDSFFPAASTLSQNNGSTYPFSVTTTQPMNSNKWLLDAVEVSSGSQNYDITWTHASTHNITYLGSNGNGSVSKTWIVDVIEVIATPTPTPSPTPTPTVTPTPNPTPSPTPTPIPSAVYNNRLRESSPDTVLGGNSYIDIGQIPATSRYRDVLWYDLSAYNKTDKITNAMFSLFWYYPSNIRNQSTTIEIYRPLAWDPTFVNWNNRTYNTPWNNPGGSWFDRNNAAQGNVPFASITFNANSLPDNKFYAFNVTELVQNYVAGTYNNTGFFLKAKDENDNYIAFYSSDWSNASQRPKLTINYTTGGTPSNPAPSITSFSPGSLTPGYAVNSTTPFSVTTDQQVSSSWYLNGANQNNNAQAWSHTWDIPGQYNLTYVGVNGNGSVSIMWNVTVVSPYDLNGDGYVNEADLEVISSNFGSITYAPYPPYDVIDYGIVDVCDITAVSTNILE